MGRCCHPAASHESLSGRDCEGCFKTARGKVYPQGLNRAIANAVIDYVQCTFAPSNSQFLPTEFCDLLVNDFVTDGSVQPDFYS